MRRLILHVGNHRTATSSLQAYLTQNTGPLQQRGFLYPRPPGSATRHLALFNALLRGATTPEQVARTLNRQADEAEHPVHTIVLSDEDVCQRRDLSALGDLSRWFDLEVVYTLRRQDSWLESWYLQNIKWQWNPRYAHVSWPDFLQMRDDFHWIHYDRALDHMESVFGAAALRPRVFERAAMPEGPIAAFCDVIGLDDRSGLLPEVTRNERFSVTTSEFLRHLPLDQLEEPRRAVVEAAVQRGEGNATSESTLLLDPTARAGLLAEYAPGNEAVARRFFQRGLLFEDPVPTQAPTPLMLPPSEQLMREFVGPLVLELGRMVPSRARPVAAPGAIADQADPPRGLPARLRRRVKRVLRRWGWSVSRV